MIKRGRRSKGWLLTSSDICIRAAQEWREEGYFTKCCDSLIVTGDDCSILKGCRVAALLSANVQICAGQGYFQQELGITTKNCGRNFNKMRRLVVLLAIVFLVSIYSVTTVASAIEVPPNEPFEEMPLKSGYVTVEDAVKECERHFHQEIKLPLRLPPVSFTHQFGRCNDLPGEVNDGLDIWFFNEHEGKNHYMLWIRPSRYRLDIPHQREVIKIYELKDKSKAIYGTTSRGGFYLLSFEKGGWQYILSVDHRITDKITAENLVEIAESVRLVYPDPNKENPLLR